MTINNPASTAVVGLLVAGLLSHIGDLQWGASIGVTDYSTKEKDAFGNTNIVERAFSKKMSGELLIENGNVDYVHRMLSQYRATPILWIGSDLFESSFVFGFFKDFNIVLKSIAGSTCTLDIEGLI